MKAQFKLKHMNGPLYRLNLTDRNYYFFIFEEKK